MKLATLLVACLVVCASANPVHDQPSTPSFSDSYTVDAVIRLPYAEIVEPFTGYFDAQNGRSRVDYYGDLVLTVQRGDLKSGDLDGVSYKLAWMVDQTGAPERVCFQVNGTSDNPVTSTSVLPDVSGFTYVGNDACPNPDGTVSPSNQTCERWESNNVVGQKVCYTKVQYE